MAPKAREAIILTIDCGKSMSEKCIDCDKSVFQLSKDCLENIIRQKIFAETKNEYFLLEFSTNTSIGGKINERLSLPNFDLLNYIINVLNVSHNESKMTNVIDAIDESINQALNETMDGKYSAVKVVVFTNFNSLKESDLKRFRSEMIPKLVKTRIQLLIFSPFVPESKHKLSESEKIGVQLMEVMESSSVGFYYDLKTALKSFSDFEVKKTSSVGWYSNLQLGIGLNSLNIPIVAYSKALPYQSKKGVISVVQTNSSDINLKISDSNSEMSESGVSSVIPLKRVTTYESKNTDSNEVIQIERQEISRGFYYGQTLVPFSEDDKQMFEYNKSQKGFKIIGFTSTKNIDISQRLGKKTSYVCSDPRLKQNNHKMVFQALVSALFHQQKVAIVRYCFSDRSAPQIGHLLPFIEDNNLLLSYIQLPFAEDIRKYRFPSLEKYCPTDKQLEVFDNFIDSMDLMTADTDEEGNDCEALKSYQITDPVIQHWFCCLYYRSFNKNEMKPLPLISEDNKNLIQTPFRLSEKAGQPLTQILKNFTLQKSKEKSLKKKSASKESTTQLKSHSILPKRQKIFNELEESIEIVDMKTKITDLFALNPSFEFISERFVQYFNVLFDNFSKYEEKAEEIVDLIELFRQKSIEFNDPKQFNELMFDKIKSIRGTDLWYTLLSKEIKPIGRQESSNSLVLQESIDQLMSLNEDI